MPMPIVDSHIHLFPESHLNTFTWYTPSSPLGSQHSVSEYRQAAKSSSTEPRAQDPTSTYLKGFVFLETDRISSLSPEGWNHALDEVSFLTRIATGNPIAGEGHEPADRDLCLAIVPWAPVPAGPVALRRYLAHVRERTVSDDVWKRIAGVRYLVQDKPAGTMLEDGFVEGVKYLGQVGLTFDLGVDARQGGIWQLDEAVQMLQRVFGDGDKAGTELKIVISMFCCPFFALFMNRSLSPQYLESHPRPADKIYRHIILTILDRPYVQTQSPHRKGRHGHQPSGLYVLDRTDEITSPLPLSIHETIRAVLRTTTSARVLFPRRRIQAYLLYRQ